MKEPSCSWIGGSGLDCELGRSGWTDGKGSAALEQPAPTPILLLQGFLFFGTEVIISSVSAVSRSTVETHMQITDTSCKGACLWLLSSAWVTQQKWDFTSDKICYNHSSSVFSGVVSLQWGTCGHFPITESPFQPTSLLFIHQIMCFDSLAEPEPQIHWKWECVHLCVDGCVVEGKGEVWLESNRNRLLISSLCTANWSR